MMLTKRRRCLALAAFGAGALVASLVGASGAEAQAKKSPIRVAMVSELSGASTLVTSGRATKAGIDTVVSQVNKAGGIKGHPLEVTVYDGQTNPSAASAALRQMIASNPSYIVGFLASVDLAPSLAVVNAAKIPWIYTAGLFKEIDTPYFYGMSLSTKTAGQLDVAALKQLLGGSLKGKNLAIEALSPSPANDEKITAFKAAAKREGAQLVRTIRDPANLASWTSQAANVMAANVDAVVAMSVDSGASVVGKALKVAGFNGVFVSDTGGSADATLTSVAMPNFYVLREAASLVPGSPLVNAVRNAGLAASLAKASPSQFGRGYGAAWSLVRALQKCGESCPRDKFLSTMKSMGKVDVPLSPFFGPLDFGGEQSGVDTVQLYKLDSASKLPMKAGPALTLG